MAERDVEELDKVPADEREAITRGAEALAQPIFVEVNYPKPTQLSQVVADVASWSGMCFVMEPSVSTPVQIFAPRALPPDEAYDLFLTSLSLVGLRAVQVGAAVKIVPISLVTAA